MIENHTALSYTQLKINVWPCNIWIIIEKYKMNNLYFGLFSEGEVEEEKYSK